MSTRPNKHHSLPDPTTRISGGDSWGGWWVFPLVLAIITLLLIVAAAAIQGTGQDSGSPAAGQTTSSPATSPAPER